ncbi:MAG TPA: MarR family transcriptional regulator [Candidatus Saccharimonadales bacterium]|nr:MarR family transcriptional regulator [Candidatus Saccharimonadales bacterium]
MLLNTLERVAISMVAITTLVLEEVAGPELTFLGWRVLVVVGLSEEPIRIGDLALALRVSRPSASKLIRRLVRRDLVALRPDPLDGRGVFVALTAEGRRMRAAVIDRRRQILAQATAEPLPERFESALSTLADRLERWT